MILIDTGPLVAAVHPQDKQHERALGLLAAVSAGRYGQPLSTDYILAEGLTLIQVRVGRRDIADRFAALFSGAKDHSVAALAVRSTGADILEEAIELHFQHYDRRLSVTDCSLVAHARRLQAVIGTFDGRFAGVAPVVDA